MGTMQTMKTHMKCHRTVLPLFGAAYDSLDMVNVTNLMLKMLGTSKGDD